MEKRYSILRKMLIPLFLLCLGIPAVAGQTLADLAKEERERRANSKPKVRVLSNKSVESFQKGSVSTGVYGEATQGEKKESQAEGQDGEKEKPAPEKDERYWREEFKKAGEEVKAADNKSTLAQLQLNQLWNEFYREDDGFFRETIMKKITDKNSEIEKLKKDLEEAQKALDKLNKEARQNNVPPGWLR